MDLVYLHLLLNHIPVEITGLGVLGLIAAFITKRRAVWLYALATLALGGAGSTIAWLTGHGAEDAVRDSWWAMHGTIAAHEDAANWATALLLLLAIVAVMGWLRLVRDPAAVLPTWMRGALLVLALAGMAAVTRTAYLGGHIEHDSPLLKPPAKAPAGIVLPPGSGDKEEE